jgi:uncharacterized protein YbjT (DUF2867 family)
LLTALQGSGARTRTLVHSDQGESRVKAAGADETIKVEFAETASLAAALKGADIAYMITPALDQLEKIFATNAVQAAESDSVQRFVRSLCGRVQDAVRGLPRIRDL